MEPHKIGAVQYSSSQAPVKGIPQYGYPDEDQLLACPLDVAMHPPAAGSQDRESPTTTRVTLTWQIMRCHMFQNYYGFYIMG